MNSTTSIPEEKPAFAEGSAMAMSVAEAQTAKLEHICTKLMLKDGDRFLDIGAGWGGLLLFAAENYGVRAQGITLSKNQHAHVNKMIAERGLAGRVRMDLLDPTDRETQCPYKGRARYWSARVGDTIDDDIAWSYPFPIPECPKIENLVCFYDERVERIEVDGEVQPRPTTPWS